eukprot:6863142-Alexandrium_andersonii.AAC.1
MHAHQLSCTHSERDSVWVARRQTLAARAARLGRRFGVQGETWRRVLIEATSKLERLTASIKAGRIA